MLLLFIGIHYPSQAVNLQINEELTIRVGVSQDGESYGKPVGILPKGSIVDIPDEYVVKDDSGKVNIDFTLNKWFEKGGMDFLMKDGISAFHTPINVIHPPLDPALSGKKLHVALQNLKLKSANSTLMNVIEDSELVSVIENTENETEAGSLCSGICALQDERIDQSTQDFISKMRDLTDNVIAKEVRSKSIKSIDRLHRDSKTLNSRLKTYCAISQEEICSEVENVIKKHQLPYECHELVGLLLLESSGNCRAINKNITSSDIGLFQINTQNLKKDVETGQAKICTDKEWQKLMKQAEESKDAIAFWKAQPKPQCVTNPIYSLRKAGEILKQNKNYYPPRIPGITKDEHRDLFRRLIFSGYNGGQGNAVNVVRDLELFNTDLQKKLSEGGKDITRSNRGILKIKQEINTIDNGLGSVNRSLRNLASNIQKAENALSQITTAVSRREGAIPTVASSIEESEKKLKNIPIQADQKIAQRRQEMSSKITEAVENNIWIAEPLVQQWNHLNQQDVSLITEQQKILSHLDDSLQSTTDLRRKTNPSSRMGRVLAIREKALNRFISEVEEEKWPYYMDQLLMPAESSSKQSLVDRMVKGFMDGKENAIQFVTTQGKKIFQEAVNIHADVVKLMNSETEKEWDFYQIRSLESVLARKQNSLQVAIKKYPKLIDKLSSEITDIQKRLSEARSQRRADIKNILNQRYRNGMSQAERARALKILESEIEMIKIDIREDFSKTSGEALRNFFYPESVSRKYHHYNQLKDAQTEIHDKYATKKRRDAHPRTPFAINAKEEAVSFLLEVMAKSNHNPNTTYLSALKKWHNKRTQVDQKRRDLEGNSIFQEIKPFLKEKTGDAGAKDLVLGPRAKHFYESQARMKHNKEVLDQEIGDIARMNLDTNLTSEKINMLQEKMAQLQSELGHLRSEQKEQKQQRKILLVDKVEKLDQEELLTKQREQAQMDLATSKKDPYNWEHLKQFYFAAELKKGIENSGLISSRSSDNAIINIGYVDALLGTTPNQKGFLDSDAGKNLCPQSSS